VESESLELEHEILETQLPEKMKTSDFIPVLSNRGFLFLWLGQLFSQLADRLYVYVLMLLAYSLTSSNLGVSMPLLAFGISSVLFGSVAGVYVDLWNRKWILIITSILRGLIILLAIPFVTNSIGAIFLFSFLIYTVAQFFAPAESASIPELVEKHNLIIANSLFMMTWMAASVVGLGLGAPVVAIMGKTGTLLSVGVIYFLASTAIIFVPLKYHKTDKQEKAKDVYIELWKGFVFIWRNQVIKYALLKLFVTTSAIAVISLLAIPYAEKVLKIGAANYGYLIITTGIGMFVGLLTLHRLTDSFKKATIVIASFLVSGSALFAMAFSDHLGFALFMTFILGVGNIYLTSTIQTILQNAIPREMRGRVFGFQNMLINSSFTLPVVICGLVADVIGVGATLGLLGLGVFAMGIAGMFLPKFKTV
jgi:predicted MFS family arabinose efflux permease